MRPRSRQWILAAAVLVVAVPGSCEDSDRLRYYLGVQFGESNPITKANDVAGVSLGANLGRHIGLELDVDKYELELLAGSTKAGEIKLYGFVPQVRLRYPLFGDRLTPYFVGGVGLGLTEVNDTKVTVNWSDGNTDTRALATVGGGLEYFLRDNITFGVEGKYFITGSGSFSAADTVTPLNLNAGVLTFGLRFFYPELQPTVVEVAGNSKTRFYFGVRLGGAHGETSQIFPDVTASGGIPDSPFSLLLGLAVGVDFGSNWGIELSLENYEPKISLPGLGRIGEYSLFPVLLQPRWRYPMMNGRLEPYVLGGIGAEKAELNDTKQSVSGLGLSANDFSVVGSLGAGIQYFIMDDFAISFELKYILSRGHSFQIGDNPPMTNGDLDALFLSVGLRAYLFDL